MVMFLAPVLLMPFVVQLCFIPKKVGWIMQLLSSGLLLDHTTATPDSQYNGLH